MKSSTESALPPPGGAIAAGVSDVECDEARAGGGATRSRAPCSRGFRTAGPRKPVLTQPAVQTPALIAARPSERTIRANMPLDYSSPTFVRAHPGRPGHRRTHSCPLSPAVSRVKSEASRRELELHASRLHAAVGRLTLLRGAINKDGAAARRTSPLSSPSQSPSSPRTVSPLSLRCHDEA